MDSSDFAIMSDGRYDAEYDDGEAAKGLANGCLYLMATFCGIMAALCALSLVSCSTPREVVVEKVRTEYAVRTDTLTMTDTVRQEKETIVREARAEDSAMLAVYGIRLKENERLLLFLQKEIEDARSRAYTSHTDTVVRVDSVEVPVTVERKMTKWEGFFLGFGRVMANVALVVSVLLLILWIRRKG